MKPYRVLLATCLTLFASYGFTEPCDTSSCLEREVVDIVDGDTLLVGGAGNGFETRLRLTEIDSPDRMQPWGTRAKEALGDKVLHRRIRIASNGEDRFGRLLGRVYLGHRDINREMVREGHAWAYREYLTDKSLLEDERRAREMRAGWWSLPEGNRMPPWEWRRNGRPTTAPALADESSTLDGDTKISLILQDPFQFDTPADRCSSKACIALVELIDNAQRSIDFAIYGSRDQSKILTALRSARERGVTVRGYVDKDVGNESYYSSTGMWIRELVNVRDDFHRESSCNIRPPDSGYSCRRPSGFEGPLQCLAYRMADGYLIAGHASRESFLSENLIMHNKFFVFDKARVWTGSANISNSGTGGYNANAVVVINDERIAATYGEEFEQLWNREASSCEKTRNGVESFDLSNAKVTTWFSPQDGTSRFGLKSLIARAESRINVAVFFLTSKFIAADLMAAHRRGVSVRVILDATAAKNGYSKHELLREAGIPVKVENWGGKMHMKSASVDGSYLVAGSMNWTAAGERSNDENTLIIESDELASQFDQYYDSLWTSIPDEWLAKGSRPDPESKASAGSCSDGIDNDFDDLLDAGDPGCSENPPPMLSLPPHHLVSEFEFNGVQGRYRRYERRRGNIVVAPSRFDSIQGQYRLYESQACLDGYDDWFVCLPDRGRDVDCSDIPYRNMRVSGDDPFLFDIDGDGVGCEKWSFDYVSSSPTRSVR